jgi:hypothetical protein
VTTPEDPNGSDAVRDAVVASFVLGWHVAELFHANVPGTVQRRPGSVDRLTGIGELDPLSRARLLLTQVRVDLATAWRFGRSGQDPPDTGPVQALLEADMRQPGQLRAAVAELHRQLLMALTAADFRLGKAYGLGRALAQTALVPDAQHPETFRRIFARFRLDNLLGWLADLRSAFPPHAAEAVSGSLQAWAAWSDAPTLRPAVGDPGQAQGRRPRRPSSRPVDWSAALDRESVTRALHRQGQLWRALLSGERHGLDLLSSDDYLSAADQLLGHLRRLTMRFLRRFWITTTVVAATVATALVVVVVVRAASAVVAAILAAAGTIGITWKGAASGLGRVLAQAQRPLWDSELDVAVANAVTWLPRERRAAGWAAIPADAGGTDERSQG